METVTGNIEVDGTTLTWRCAEHVLQVEPWGASSARIRARPGPGGIDLPGALLPQPDSGATLEETPEGMALVNGRLRVELARNGRLRFLHAVSGQVLLEEPEPEILFPPAREFRPLDGNLWAAEARFLPGEDERFYGLGQHRHGRLNQKGCVLDLRQENCEVSIPFLVSNRGYGFLWHNPALGRVELGHTRTRWTADMTDGVDYWITTGDAPGDLLSHYVDATGHAPRLPAWASGFWQCKLRYKTQAELLDVAREYRRRDLPLSVIVIDFFHWTRMGDFVFDPEEWPDPEGMIRELEDMGIKVMVSVWPSFNINSRNHAAFANRGFLATLKGGVPASMRFVDRDQPGETDIVFYDPTHPDARRLFWDKIHGTYYRQGFRIFWLDCCEPQLPRQSAEHLRYHLGDGKTVAGLYPLLHAQAFHTGMTEAGETDFMFLSRSAWAGSQRYAAALWSGDIKSTFEVLQGQIRAGLNVAMSGIPWWTTDIGGFHSGDPSTPYFRELIVRWFQYGVFCPLFRLHGVREPVIDHRDGGQPNEAWSFGDEAYGVIRDLLHLRERLRPYIMTQMQAASDRGRPVMRPLFFDYPDDAACWDVEDAFLFGPDILVAPVATPGQREREVYLPAGPDWIDAWTGASQAGGQWITASAPLERIPVYLRQGGSIDTDVFATSEKSGVG